MEVTVQVAIVKGAVVVKVPAHIYSMPERDKIKTAVCEDYPTQSIILMNDETDIKIDKHHDRPDVAKHLVNNYTRLATLAWVTRTVNL
jgi:hypothetical protein